MRTITEAERAELRKLEEWIKEEFGRFDPERIQQELDDIREREELGKKSGRDVRRVTRMQLYGWLRFLESQTPGYPRGAKKAAKKSAKKVVKKKGAKKR